MRILLKVDMLHTPPATLNKIEAMARVLNIKLLAEKVETREEYEDVEAERI